VTARRAELTKHFNSFIGGIQFETRMRLGIRRTYNVINSDWTALASKLKDC